MRPSRAAWVEVRPAAVRRNARAVRALRPGRGLIAVVKEDAYGHGAVAVARALRGVADAYAVAVPEEGEALRRAGIGGEILLLTPVDAAGLRRAAAAALTVTLAAAGDPLPRSRAGGRLPAHLKVDTGMSRLGVAPAAVPGLARALARRGVRWLAGTYTHLAAGADRQAAALQVARLRAAARQIRAAGIEPGPLHAANSEAVLGSPEACALDAIRPGLLLYGCRPAGAAGVPALAPAMAFKTRILSVRDVARGEAVGYGGTWRAPSRALLAVLPVGYAAGYSRLQSGRGRVLVRGRAVPVRGRISMNLTLAEVTGIPGVRAGDEVVLFGAQRGARVDAGEVAARQGTIPYEVLCVAGGLNPRVVRA